MAACNIHELVTIKEEELPSLNLVVLRFKEIGNWLKWKIFCLVLVSRSILTALTFHV